MAIVRETGIPVVYGRTEDLRATLADWLAEHDDGIACVIGDDTFVPTPRVQSLAPELSKGLEFDLVILVEPEKFGQGIAGVIDRYVAMTRATQQLVVLSPDASPRELPRAPRDDAVRHPEPHR